MRAFTFSFIFATLCLSTCLACPDFWTQFGDSCYKTSEHPETWYSSREYCRNLGGYLVEINDEFEQSAMYSLLPVVHNYWTGLTDEDEEGVWVWQESMTPPEFIYWSAGEPNNDDGSGNPENCMLLSENTLLWNDVRCDINGGDIPIYALCECQQC